MTNKEVVIGFFNAMDNNDSAIAERLLGENHQFHTTMSPVPMNAEQHIGLSKAMNESFSDGRHEMVDVLEAGNKVVVRAIWHGTHTGSFNGIPASGKTVHLSFIAICEIENEEIKNQWAEMDGMSLMMQIGAMPMS